MDKMKDIIKIERDIIAPFLINIERCLEYIRPSITAIDPSYIEAQRLLIKIKDIIREQDGEQEQKPKFKQLKLL